MLRLTQKPHALPLLALSLCAAVLVCGALALTAHAAVQKNTLAVNKPPAERAAKEADAPPYQEYKGVRIGMSADEARKILGAPTDKGDKQDFYVLSDNETAQIFYDAEKKVMAVAAVYIGTGNSVPAPKAIVGSEIEPKPDGSLYKLVSYPKAGFWVSYCRSAGDSPVTSITMQKK